MKPPKPVSESSASTVAWWSCPGVVYFVAVGEPPIAIKIGMSAQTGMSSLRETIVRRLSQIQSSNHELVRLLGVIYFNEGEYPTRQAEARERELHAEFAHLQRFKPFARGAEWFTSSPELLARIEQMATMPEELNLPCQVSVVADRNDKRD